MSFAHRTITAIARIAMLSALAPVASAGPPDGTTIRDRTSPDLVTMATLDFKLAPGALQDPPADAGDAPLPTRPLPGRFGDAGTSRMSWYGGGGFRLNETADIFGLGGVGFSHFIADGLSLNLELGGGYFNLDRAKDSWAVNANLLFRWHFHNDVNWSLYMDGGAGVLIATNELPRGGTNFNFTPQAGVGVSFDIGPDTRMLVGVRWHHISNGSLYSTNPGMDNLYAYLALSMPF